MPDRPYTLLSCGMSIDGYLGRATPRRLELSNEADFDRVDAVRASCDAIMVGAATVRNDNPRLLVRSPQRRAERLAKGLSPSPMKVTLTRRGDLDSCRDEAILFHGARFSGLSVESPIMQRPCALPARRSPRGASSRRGGDSNEASKGAASSTEAGHLPR